MAAEQIKRVQYSKDQYLNLQEFVDEQEYHVAMRRRHNVTGHGWGVATGLAVTFEAGRLTVHPGYAVDKFGRELVLTEPLTMVIPARKEQQLTYDIWLCYHRRKADRVPREFDPTCTQWSRWLEEPVLKVTPGEPGEYPDPDNPPGVSDCHKQYRPTRPAPEEKVSWPVFLARLTTRSDRDSLVDEGRRRYVSVVATMVKHPQHDTCLRLSDRPECSISVGGRTALTMRRENVTVSGALVTGELIVDAGVVGFAGRGSDTPAGPWTVYRTDLLNNHELRVELPEDDGTDKASFVIGSWSVQEKKFLPCLSVSTDGVVTVDGALLVRGRIDGYTGGGSTVDDNLGAAIAAQLAANETLRTMVARCLLADYPAAAVKLRELLGRKG